MSTNKTKNYQLHAWKPTDDFLLTEINQNFEKLDRLMPRIVMGSYIKSGSGDMVVDLGFRPKAVHIENQGGSRGSGSASGGLFLDGDPYIYGGWNEGEVTDTGFRVSGTQLNGGMKYFYVAFWW